MGVTSEDMGLIRINCKAYVNNFSAAITNQVYVEENESHLINKSDLIKTDRILKIYNYIIKRA